MWSDRNVLDSLLWEAAVDDMGIYPRAVVRDGVETPRSEWQDGWNAAVIEITQKHGALTKWVEMLTDEQRGLIQGLLDSDVEPMSLGLRDGAVVLHLTCGDTFAYACADAEPFGLDDLPEIDRLWKAHGYSGMVAWIAHKRQQEPVKEYRYDAGYLAAKADLVASLTHRQRDERECVCGHLESGHLAEVCCYIPCGCRLFRPRAGEAVDG